MSAPANSSMTLKKRQTFVLTEGRHWDVDPESGCWIWKKFSQRGYGRTVGGWAHRAVWRQLVGPLPRSVHLHHLCPNTLCVNPDHLMVIDPTVHAQHHCRERWSSLTPEMVLELRERAALLGPEDTIGDLAAEYGIHRATANDIIRGHTWAEVGGPRGRPTGRVCSVCGQSIDHRKRSAKTCGGNCRQAAHKRRTASLAKERQ